MTAAAGSTGRLAGRALLASAVAGWLVTIPALVAATGTDADLAPLSESLSGTIRSLRGRSGVVVVDDAGRTVFSHNADLPLNPASNAKILVVGAALSLLGPDYRFTTSVSGTRQGDEVVGPLYLVGGGDPSFNTASLSRLVDELVALGLRSVRGPLIVDDSIFRVAGDPPGFRRFRSTQPFRAGVSGLSFNANVVQVTVAPAPPEGRHAVVNLSPPSDYFRLIRRVRSSGRRTRLHVASFRRGTRRTGVTVSGWIHRDARTRRFWRRVHHPALYAGHTLIELLKGAGITVSRGVVRRGRAPEAVAALASHRSPSLSRIIRRATKYSSNVKAEMLLLSLGAAVFGQPGTYGKGRRAVAQFMNGMGIDPATYRLENGSGLSHRSSIRARDLVRVLARLQADFALGPEFLAALPLAGHDGTLRRVYEGSPAAGHVRAKTGTLNRTTCMSGYVSWEGRSLIFSLMSARVRHRGWARKQHVAMTEALLTYLQSSTASGRHDVAPEARPTRTASR